MPLKYFLWKELQHIINSIATDTVFLWSSAGSHLVFELVLAQQLQYKSHHYRNFQIQLQNVSSKGMQDKKNSSLLCKLNFTFSSYRKICSTLVLYKYNWTEVYLK